MATSIDGYIDDMNDARLLLSNSEGDKLVYARDPVVRALRAALGDVATVVAARFVHPGRFPQDAEHPMTLVETRQIGDVVLLRYLPTTTGR